jgi:acyl carrier protein
MNRQLSAEDKKNIYDHIREFLSEELGVPIEEIKPETRIIDDLGGDSIIYLELIEEFKKKYRVTIEVRVIGKYFQKHPIYTVDETARAVYDIIERGENLLESED